MIKCIVRKIEALDLLASCPDRCLVDCRASQKITLEDKSEGELNLNSELCQEKKARKKHTETMSDVPEFSMS